MKYAFTLMNTRRMIRPDFSRHFAGSQKAQSVYPLDVYQALDSGHFPKTSLSRLRRPNRVYRIACSVRLRRKSCPMRIAQYWRCVDRNYLSELLAFNISLCICSANFDTDSPISTGNTFSSTVGGSSMAN